MKQNKSVLFVVICCFFSSLMLNGQNITFEEAKDFTLQLPGLASKDLTCGYLNVPETWEATQQKLIKVGAVVLKNTSGLENADAVVFIQGGPGASGVNSAGLWVDHPLREKNDIVLFDVRGTGISKPRLCPDLGFKFLEILAKNQSAEEDEEQKTNVALSCKQDLITRGINTDAYNSLSVAKDLHALKTELKYKKWTVYGASYGTYMAQVYASTFPEDVKSLILDSSVADISEYYTQNTGNYISSLSRVFEKCKNDPECDARYPNLEEVFYQTIEKLDENPLTVYVPRRVLKSQEFTYNSEDFKVAIQQALYSKDLIEVLPLLIYQFHNRNGEALGNLVEAFSTLLTMDYGVYYCVSCNEALPNNDFSSYQNNASKIKKLKGGISFYRSDFKVCDKWNLTVIDSLLLDHDLSGLADLSAPVMIFAGEFDPITPSSNGAKTAKSFSNSYVVKGNSYGHIPSFTDIGNELTGTFVNTPNQKPNLNAFAKVPEMAFPTDIKLNRGVSSIGTTISQLNPLFIMPLLVAGGLMIVFIFIYIVNFIRGEYKVLPDKLVRVLSLVTSIAGVAVLIGFVLAVLEVSGSNQLILAFGLPDSFSYLFTGLFIFVGLLILTMIFFFLQIRKISERSVVFSVIFSHIVLAVYFLYWGVL